MRNLFSSYIYYYTEKSRACQDNSALFCIFLGFNQLFFASIAHFVEHAQANSSGKFQKSPMSISHSARLNTFRQPEQILVDGQDILAASPPEATKIILKNVSTSKVSGGASPSSRFQNITETKFLIVLSRDNKTTYRLTAVFV